MNIMSEKMSGDLIGQLERIEIEAWSDLFAAASDQTIQECGLRLLTDNFICASIVSKMDVLALNRVIGLGMTVPATENSLMNLRAEYARYRVPRFFVQLCPAAEPALIKSWLLNNGFKHYNNWVKLYRGVEPLTPVKTDLEIERIGKSEADSFAHILTVSFDWPRIQKPWIAQTVGRPGWRHYLAYDKSKPVATGAIYINGQFGWIDFASTLPGYRGRGAQGALVERRIRDAAELGCKWLTVETAEETPIRSAPSFRNMRRYGFEVAYIRPNYIYYINK